MAPYTYMYGGIIWSIPKGLNSKPDKAAHSKDVQHYLYICVVEISELFYHTREKCLGPSKKCGCGILIIKSVVSGRVLHTMKQPARSLKSGCFLPQFAYADPEEACGPLPSSLSSLQSHHVVDLWGGYFLLQNWALCKI